MTTGTVERLRMRPDIQALFSAHYADLLRYVRRLIGEGAEDITASVFELATQKLDAAHPAPAGWLFRTARNLVAAETRRIRRDLQASRDFATVEVTAGEHSDIEALSALLASLPPRQREVLQLTYWDELTAAEVGVVLGCSEATVWKRVSRAKAHLRRLWETQQAESEGGTHV